MASKQKRPSRKRLECLRCGQTFTDDYRHKHNQKHHGALLAKNKAIPYKLEGAPDNPFELAKRRRKATEITHLEVEATDETTSQTKLATTIPARIEDHLEDVETITQVPDLQSRASSKTVVVQIQSDIPSTSTASRVDKTAHGASSSKLFLAASSVLIDSTEKGPDTESVRQASPIADHETGPKPTPALLLPNVADGIPHTVTQLSVEHDAKIDIPAKNADGPAEKDGSSREIRSSWKAHYPNDPANTNVNSASDLHIDKDQICKYGPCQPKLKTYPMKKQHDRMRSFQESWYTRVMPSGKTISRDWLEYSPTKDAMFCFACRIFGTATKTSDSSIWATDGVSNWKKGLEKMLKHEDSKPHLAAAIAWKIFEGKGNVSEQLQNQAKLQREKEIEHNRNLLKRLLDIVFFLAKQNLPFRGHQETGESSNKGNFLELVELLARYDTVLQKHIDEAKKNERYFSPKIQNDFIEALAHTVREEIINRIKQADCYSIIMDETSDCSRIEQVSIVFRYAIEGETYESFIKFQNVESTTGAALYDCLCTTLQTLGLEINKLRRQGYDGASNMSGRYSGVKTRVLNENPKALYIHCNNHCLNLVLVDSCKSTVECKKFFGVVERLYSFIEASPKRHAIFLKHQKNRNVTYPTSLKKLSDTRWACHTDALRVVEKTLPAILDTLDEIVEEENDSKIVSNASGLLEAISTYNFIAAFVVLKDILETIRVASDALQERGISVDKAVGLVDEAMQTLEKKRRDDHFESLIQKADQIATTCDIPTGFKVHAPRRRKRMAGELARDEVLEPSLEFKANVFYTSIDTCLVQLNERFQESRKIHDLFNVLLMPALSNTDRIDTKKVEELARFYASDPSPDVDAPAVNTEYEAWKHHVENAVDLDKKHNGQDLFRYFFTSNLYLVMPNLYRLYSIFCSLPSTSVEAERSFSKLKIIKDYRRSTMGQTRLSGLALLSIERNASKNISFDEVIKVFAEMRPRRKTLLH